MDFGPVVERGKVVCELIRIGTFALESLRPLRLVFGHFTIRVPEAEEVSVWRSPRGGKGPDDLEAIHQTPPRVDDGIHVHLGLDAYQWLVWRAAGNICGLDG